MQIEAQDAMEAWKELLVQVVQKGQRRRYKNRDAIECLNVVTKFQPKRVDEPIVTLNSLGKWVYPSLEEIADSLFAKEKDADYLYTYGPRLFRNGGVNQVDDFLIPLLREKPDSGRAVLSVWRQESDSLIGADEVPGIVMFDFKLRNDELHVTAVIRNNNLLFGWPANIYQTFVIQKYVASKIDAKLGTITILSCSAHVYEDTLPHIKKIVGKRLRV